VLPAHPVPRGPTKHWRFGWHLACPGAAGMLPSIPRAAHLCGLRVTLCDGQHMSPRLSQCLVLAQLIEASGAVALWQ